MSEAFEELFKEFFKETYEEAYEEAYIPPTLEGAYGKQVGHLFKQLVTLDTPLMFSLQLQRLLIIERAEIKIDVYPQLILVLGDQPHKTRKPQVLTVLGEQPLKTRKPFCELSITPQS